MLDYAAIKRERRRKLGHLRYQVPSIRQRHINRAKTQYALPIRQSCSIKGCNELGERHHPDIINKPLEIIWLCPFHHLKKWSGEMLNWKSKPQEDARVIPAKPASPTTYNEDMGVLDRYAIL